VTTSERRLVNLKAITEQAGGRSRFWFTTASLASAGDILTGLIWQVAGYAGAYALHLPKSDSKLVPLGS
jgi:hypothetical protein